MYLNIDSGKLRDVVAFGRATIDLYANEIGPMEDAVTFHKYVGGSGQYRCGHVQARPFCRIHR